jgi:crotonobetainyl-CoA:carnitine CoA-transferase CaiB-like acyl-CoA transferase
MINLTHTAQSLAGVRVLDLTRILAGPWCTQILADLGAEVVKIERPEVGDDTRSWGPPYLTDSDGGERDAAYFHAANRGKKSVAVDIASAEGQALVRKLVSQSDVVIENFKVGGLKAYGLDYESLAALKPSLVYCSITGFGQTGPYAERAGYDFMVQGMGGLMSLTGQPDGTPGAEPLKVGVALTDVLTGLYASIGILAALRHRDATGAGQHIDMSLLDVQVATLANQSLNYLATGTSPKRLGNSHPNIVPYQAFATADGHIILAVGNDRQFQRFCELVGRADLGYDPLYATNPARVANRQTLIPILTDVLAKRTTDEWIEDLAAVGVPAGPINDLERVFADPQVQARGMQTAPRAADGATVHGVASPIKMSATPPQDDRAAPRLGEHTDDVLSELLDITAEDLGRLRAAGVIGAKT